MTPEERLLLERFLEPPLIALLATIAPDGSPQLSPVWYRFANGRLTVSTTKQTVKHNNLSRDSRTTVCVYSGPEALEYCTLSGRVEISDDESIWPETRAIIERYDTAGETETRLTRLKTQDRVIISLSPDRVLLSRSDGRRITRLAERSDSGA